jgi:hypothetical protein
MDSQFIGSVINALPLEHMIGGPLQAMIKAGSGQQVVYRFPAFRLY